MSTTKQPTAKKALRFWAIILALAVTGLLTALEYSRIINVWWPGTVVRRFSSKAPRATFWMSRQLHCETHFLALGLLPQPTSQLPSCSHIQDPAIVSIVSGGEAYQHATRIFLDSLPNDVRVQVKSIFLASQRRTWQVATGFAGLGFALVSLEKEIKLRQELDTDFGMKTKEKKEGGSNGQAQHQGIELDTISYKDTSRS
ncbi:MAG: hypothetical protein Q9213_002171 [Squamulea squamosa]